MTTWLHECSSEDLREKIVAAIGRGVSKQAARRTRATLPIEGLIWLAQRYAVDYEQLATLKPSAMASGPNISS